MIMRVGVVVIGGRWGAAAFLRHHHVANLRLARGRYGMSGNHARISFEI